MNRCIFYSAGDTDALRTAQNILQKSCCFLDHPSPDLTHLLLPVPSFAPDGTIKGGGSVGELLCMLPENITVIGGGLNRSELSGHPTIDLLEDEGYLAGNAAITAHCALKLALNHLPVTLEDCSVLVIGWGRIGKCLARLLKAVGADVTIAARKEADRAIARALGYNAESPSLPHRTLSQYRVIFNTVPAPVLSEDRIAHCRPDCLMIDLASSPGIAGDGVLWARGLPSRDAPESSGALIANTVLYLLDKKE